MTKVILSPSVLEYREEMAELVREVSKKTTISGVSPRSRNTDPDLVRKEPPVFRLDGLLGPPRIEVLYPYLCPPGKQLDSIIQITALGDYGVISVYVTLEDEWGKQIESGFALRDRVERDDWYYFPSASLRSGASVTVRATAMDPLGGTAIGDETVTV
jgi:hypothetical protein